MHWFKVISCLITMVVILSCGHKSRRANANTVQTTNDNNNGLLVTVIGQPDESDDKDILIPIIINRSAHQLLRRKSYISSYNKETRCPNWVAWRLCASQLDGKIPRDNTYYEDEEVPSPRATNDDYKGSGWSHGHMCPAADNKWNEIAMRESNLLTNICPQDKNLNSGIWNRIEQNCRKWAKMYGDLYIVCGPILFEKEHETIGNNRVVVPEAFFKVIMRIQPSPCAIGYIVKNNDGVKKKDLYVNTVDEVERITGIDFYPALPDSIEDIVESIINLEDWK